MYNYYIINKSDNLCIQHICSFVSNWSINDDEKYSICLSENSDDFVGQYYYDGTFHV